MGPIGFMKYIYAYFVPSSNSVETKVLQVEATSGAAAPHLRVFSNPSTLVPVYNSAGKLVQFMERPFDNWAPRSDVTMCHPNCLAHGKDCRADISKEEGKYARCQLEALPASLPKQKTKVEKQLKPQLEEEEEFTEAASENEEEEEDDEGEDSEESKEDEYESEEDPKDEDYQDDESDEPQEPWDRWPNGNFERDFTHEQYKQVSRLRVHWSFRSGPGHPVGAVSAKQWRQGRIRELRCQGVLKCTNPSCGVYVRPKPTIPSARAQLSKPCVCGQKLAQTKCEARARKWTWTGGVHYQHEGYHHHLRPTHKPTYQLL